MGICNNCTEHRGKYYFHDRNFLCFGSTFTCFHKPHVIGYFGELSDCQYCRTRPFSFLQAFTLNNLFHIALNRQTCKELEWNNQNNIRCKNMRLIQCLCEPWLCNGFTVYVGVWWFVCVCVCVCVKYISYTFLPYF